MGVQAAVPMTFSTSLNIVSRFIFVAGIWPLSLCHVIKAAALFLGQILDILLFTTTKNQFDSRSGLSAEILFHMCLHQNKTSMLTVDPATTSLVYIQLCAQQGILVLV